jgi:DNA-binding NarL/FixJ family response regulator
LPKPGKRPGTDRAGPKRPELPPSRLELEPSRINLPPPKRADPEEQIKLLSMEEIEAEEQMELLPAEEPDEIELLPAEEIDPEPDEIELLPAEEIDPELDEIELLPAADEDADQAASTPDDEQNSLEEAESLVARSRKVSEALFKEARRMPEYNRVLATRKRSAQFEAKLLATAKRIDARLGTMLPPDALQYLVTRLANRVGSWEHSPERQKVRQRKQVAARRKKTLGRDLQIVRAIENGDSVRKVAKRFNVSKSQVNRIMQRFRNDRR